MAQKLILPINKTRITAGYKNANYKNQFGLIIMVLIQHLQIVIVLFGDLV